MQAQHITTVPTTITPGDTVYDFRAGRSATAPYRAVVLSVGGGSASVRYVDGSLARVPTAALSHTLPIPVAVAEAITHYCRSLNA